MLTKDEVYTNDGHTKHLRSIKGNSVVITNLYTADNTLEALEAKLQEGVKSIIEAIRNRTDWKPEDPWYNWLTENYASFRITCLVQPVKPDQHHAIINNFEEPKPSKEA